MSKQLDVGIGEGKMRLANVRGRRRFTSLEFYAYWEAAHAARQRIINYWFAARCERHRLVCGEDF